MASMEKELQIGGGGGMNSTIMEVFFFFRLKMKMHWLDRKASCLHRGLLNQQERSSVLACEAGSLQEPHFQ